MTSSDRSGPLAGYLIAIDVDGTLLDSTGVVRPATSEALQRAADAGAILTIATGRDWNSVAVILGDHPAFSYSLCINGIEVFKADGTELRALELEPSVVSRVITTVREALPGVSAGLGMSGDLLGEPAIAQTMPPGLDPIPIVDDVLQSVRPGVRDIVLYHPDYHERVDELVALVRAALASMPEVDVAFTGLPMAEVIPPGGGKDTALAWLAQHLSIPQSHVVAIGDGLNDLSMLRWAGTGVAMGQAVAEVHAVATESTDSNDDDGLANWLNVRSA